MENQKKSNNVLFVILVIVIVVLSLLVVGISGYIFYNKVEKDASKNENQTNNANMTEPEALAIGKDIYNNLYKYMHGFVDPMELDKSEYNEENVYNMFYYKHDNFISEFYNIFSKNIQLNDVYNEYDSSSRTYKRNFMCENPETDNMCTPYYNYIKINNQYYVDAGCRANVERMEVAEFKVEKIENNKVIYSYKLYVPQDIWIMPEEIVPNRTEKEYKEYYSNLPLRTLEIVKENNAWKINKASVPARCEWAINISN